MEKRLRSSLEASADEFLKSATKIGFKSAKPSLKCLIHSLNSNSHLIFSLPASLHTSISKSIARFKQFSDSAAPKSPQSPPSKRLRRSSRHSKSRNESNVEYQRAKRQNALRNIVECLQVYAFVVQQCASHPENVFSATDLLPAVCELHDNLIVFEEESNLCSEIASLCEEWWKRDFPGRETLISQSLPFMLSRSLTLKKKVDVHRVYALREAFALLDFEDESIEDLKLLLIRCVISPLYLKTEDGRRFLAFLFGLSGQLVKEILEMIRSQIPFGRKSMLEAYADIVFRAWKVAVGKSREEIERGFLQGLIESAIHASSGSLAASIRRVLGGFIGQRTVDGVEKLLFRLAEPVIFRSLQVANSNVRQNALHLLLDFFPLEDPEATKEVKDALLDKQFFLLERLLVDECPDVRVVAVEGSCRILHLFWEIIPSSTITKIITKVFDDIAHDLCNEVRLSTLNGIMYLLGNPQSHEILKVLLPRFGHLIVDSSLSIRAAVVDLLLLLSDMRNFQFHKVVNLDVLLPTLANDQPLVAHKITKLLMPSYFPPKVAVEEACSRCVALLRRSPNAGARFCEFALSEGASLPALLELFKVVIQLVLSSDKLDENQIDGFLVAAANLCNIVTTEASYKATLKGELSEEKVKSLFAIASSSRAQSALCHIVTNINPQAADGLHDECMGLIANCSGVSSDVERQTEVRSVHKMMLSCNWFDDMFEVLTRLLQKASYGCHIKYGMDKPKHDLAPAKGRKNKPSIKISAKWKHASSRKSSNTAKSRFMEDYANAVGVAWQMKDLLRSEDTKKAMLSSRILENAFSALKVISEASIMQSSRCDNMDALPVLAYTALALHMFLDSAPLSSEQTVLDRTIDHLLNCANNLFGTCGFGSGKSANLPLQSRKTKKVDHHGGWKHRDSQVDSSQTGEAGFISSAKKGISNMVKVLTAILKFMVDASDMDLVSQHQERCLKFTVTYVDFIIFIFKQQSPDHPLFEADIRETFLCLKSSSTYAAKLLNLVLNRSSEASIPPQEAYDIANNLLDLLTSVEEHLGSGYAARLVAAMKPWLPDLVLALGSCHLSEETYSEGMCSTASLHPASNFPSWHFILAKIELREMSQVDLDEEADKGSNLEKFSAFEKLMAMVIQLVRANHKVLDAVGVNLLSGSAVALEKKNFEFVLGILRFVCRKLARHENREWEELNLMLASLGEIFPHLEREFEDLPSTEEGRQNLQSARDLLEPVWMSYVNGTREDAMDEE